MGSKIPVPRGSPSPGEREGGGVARKGPQALPLPSPGAWGVRRPQSRGGSVSKPLAGVFPFKMDAFFVRKATHACYKNEVIIEPEKIYKEGSKRPHDRDPHGAPSGGYLGVPPSTFVFQPDSSARLVCASGPGM